VGVLSMLSDSQAKIKQESVVQVFLTLWRDIKPLRARVQELLLESCWLRVRRSVVVLLMMLLGFAQGANALVHMVVTEWTLWDTGLGYPTKTEACAVLGPS
jgi:hypothetical protein